MKQYRFNPQSSNQKTGPIPVTTSHRATCPEECPLRGAGCYAEHGPLSLAWNKTPLDIDELVERIEQIPDGQLWRHNQAGDLPGEGSRIDWGDLAKIVMANQRKHGFTYTHKPVESGPHARHNRECVETCNRFGFTVNLSADNLHEADVLADLEIGPVVAIVPEKQTHNTQTPAGRKVVICPAITHESTTCSTCKLCARRDRSVIVGFPAHGTRKRIVSDRASSGGEVPA